MSAAAAGRGQPRQLRATAGARARAEVAAAHAVGGVGQPPQRADQRRGDERRGEHGQAERERGADLEQAVELAVQRAVLDGEDVVARRAQRQLADRASVHDDRRVGGPAVRAPARGRGERPAGRVGDRDLEAGDRRALLEVAQGRGRPAGTAVAVGRQGGDALGGARDVRLGQPVQPPVERVVDERHRDRDGRHRDRPHRESEPPDEPEARAGHCAEAASR
jgi:hypothetical protein